MNTLLITDNLRRSTFIQSGIQCENMAPELIHFEQFQLRPEYFFGQNHGFFLFFESFHHLFAVLNKILAYNPNFPFIIFMKTVEDRNMHLLKKLAIHEIYTFPYAFRLIVAEMRVLIYQSREKIRESTIVLRQLKLNRQTRDVFYGDTRIQLRNREFTLLEFMMMNQGRLLSREVILEAVWDRNAEILTNTVDVHINKLRSKIDYLFGEEFIHTINCSGYIFS